MTGIDADQLRTIVVRPSLERLGRHSPAAENLLMGTAVQESRLRYLRQLGGGPALGLWQIEPATFADVYHRYLGARAELRRLVDDLVVPGVPLLEQLADNMRLGCAIARIKYAMDPAPLPAADDLEALARYWKRIYNTPAGAGTPAEFTRNYREALGVPS